VGAKFAQLGGTFVHAPEVLADRLRRISAIVLDWDGVFNRGEKARGASSGFTEADSMGLNMLRYAIWRRDRRLPAVVIITGEQNASAEELARREHFDSIYFGVKDKREAMAHCRGRFSRAPHEIACIFDDINDLAMAADCGMRVLVRRAASVLLRSHVVSRQLCDYVTASESGDHAVREAAELLLGLMGTFEEVVESRCAHDETYRAYFDVRQRVELDVVDGATLR
jgi:3-deoxy-D-manno-octulosonate 8-phosphate phosphatase (KDO 8-P phosphatase)